ncbi:MAG: tetratricopeptide repeat protein [Leptospiraceae bacterium]|nr:tetratricopeptide repeat protein [Leptospiraceae bacterium]
MKNLKKYLFFNPDSYYTPDMEPYISKEKFLSEFNELIFKEEVKAEKVARVFIISCYVFGLILTYKYKTYLLGFGAGSLALGAYFLGLKFIPYTYAQRFLNQAILQWFILQYIAQMHGMYEMHFTFFPITTMLIVYRDLFVFLITGLIPVVQHLVFFFLQLGLGYELGEYFINIDNLTVEIMFYHLLVATLHLLVVGFFCVFFRDKIAFQYQTFLRQKYIEERIIEEQRKSIEKQAELIKSYSRFVPEQLLFFLGKDIVTEINLGDSIHKEMTILFSDIRSFTSISEKMSASENFEFINDYLAKMGPTIQKNNGYIDKYLGDGIMAIFPISATDAVQTGVEMLEALNEFNLEQQKKARPAIAIGIGIHTGTQMLGIIGEHERLEGTVISDTVNTASRLEGLTKVYGSQLLVSEEVLKKMKDLSKFKYRRLGFVKVKGKSEKIAIYEVVPDFKIKEIQDYQNGILCFELGLDYYQSKNFQEAIRLFEKALKFLPNDKASNLYYQRCVEATRNGIPSDWEPVEVITEK